jgi:hypothetical protein
LAALYCAAREREKKEREREREKRESMREEGGGRNIKGE